MNIYRTIQANRELEVNSRMLKRLLFKRPATLNLLVLLPVSFLLIVSAIFYDNGIFIFLSILFSAILLISSAVNLLLSFRHFETYKHGILKKGEVIKIQYLNANKQKKAPANMLRYFFYIETKSGKQKLTCDTTSAIGYDRFVKEGDFIEYLITESDKHCLLDYQLFDPPRAKGKTHRSRNLLR